MTKFRHKVFGEQTPVPGITRAVCADFEAKLAEFNGDNNHVHLPWPGSHLAPLSVSEQYIEQQNRPN
ncbi:hypothetical protein [Micromonospora echinaurantiaca]|uniref:hypothetical protein n=1 Tax=Micromonospora echinaurantiaca TaxID=47857 RepID=UPI0037B66FE0